MSEVEALIREHLEYWCRSMETPKEILDALLAIPKAERDAAWMQIVSDGEES